MLKFFLQATVFLTEFSDRSFAFIDGLGCGLVESGIFDGDCSLSFAREG